jgi:hypothetical protein
MARSAPETVTVAPSNNVYTALAAAGTLALVFALAILFLRARDMGIDLLKF